MRWSEAVLVERKGWIWAAQAKCRSGDLKLNWGRRKELVLWKCGRNQAFPWNRFLLGLQELQSSIDVLNLHTASASLL